MSSSWMAPKDGAMAQMVSISRWGSFSSIRIGTPLMPISLANRADLPSITGREAATPTSPRPSTAVPLVTMATVCLSAVYSHCSAGSSLIARHTRATPGV